MQEKGTPMENATVLLLDLDPGQPLGPDFLSLAAEQPDRIQSAARVVPFPGGKGGAAWETEIARHLREVEPDLVVLGAGAVPWEHGRTVLRKVREGDESLPVLAALTGWEPGPILDLLGEGRIDFVTLPLRPLDIFPRLERLLAWRARGDAVLHRIKEKLGMRRMVGMSPRFLEQIGKVPAIARCDASVLLSGETGTGKEMCARAIHYLSPRADKPFTGLNCGAVPADLVENELFGHEKEAFTGAASARPGLIRETEGGTLFLDEVDSLPAQAQVKLLRFLQEKEYRALGSSRTLKADVRIIAASNMDLEKAA
ncbi:MAG TPA: sigma-54 factor interaction domain-containing protein, partial [Fibrobacteria bacterium]|nr:sigma-54 factor interaction domain-containing protein [Fibrobacteria bacterium]